MAPNKSRSSTAPFTANSDRGAAANERMPARTHPGFQDTFDGCECSHHKPNQNQGATSYSVHFAARIGWGRGAYAPLKNVGLNGLGKL